MSIGLQIALFLFVALSIVAGLFSALKAQREDLAYRQISLWLAAPLMFIYWQTITNREKKKEYFQKIKSYLFIDN